MLCIVQNLGFRPCSPQQQRWNSYMGEIRTDCSICQCKGPLKGPENLMSTHSLPCTLTFSQQYEVTYEEKDIYIIKAPSLRTKRPLTHMSRDIRTKCQKFPKDCQQNKLFSKWEWTGASIFRWPMYQLLFLSAASVLRDDFWPVRFCLNFRKGQRA